MAKFLGRVAKVLGGMDKVMEARPRPWGRDKSRGGVDKALVMLPRPCWCGQGCDGVAKDVGA